MSGAHRRGTHQPGRLWQAGRTRTAMAFLPHRHRRHAGAIHGGGIKGFFYYSLENSSNYPPKLSYMIEELSTPRLSSMLTTAFDIGPGPHM